ncbi:MAG: hypothetical protein Q4G39_08835 [Brachymonas sp.]|nr:hypothetical protein [Brachymonas sp.]
MLTRMLGALVLLLGFGVLTAWAWDKSDPRQDLSVPATHGVQPAPVAPTATAARAAALPVEN